MKINTRIPHWIDALLLALVILIAAGSFAAVAYRDALANLHDYTTTQKRRQP